MIGQLSQRCFSAPSGLLNPRPSSFRRSSRVSLSVSASLVPNFPRLVDASSVREWLAEGVPQLPGFNGEVSERTRLSASSMTNLLLLVPLRAVLLALGLPATSHTHYNHAGHSLSTQACAYAPCRTSPACCCPTCKPTQWAR